ncbi:putative zinc finger protein At1g68190 isoform X1 [Ricinus communis]|uniref:putative zinc finger protein At1g68190 isoform X1 n=1 Tax=Ricinus communis TaxID=3988 RepID=UPI00201A53B4|nr:putative zinc finger protein At1g68190 isoform X1 [Ricinus communis]XP_025014393.2 putative zinc finger protein At1g68190 isoform X1 [Ricinus communis]
MEKICEFCTALRPIIYCKADAAYLCLSCDAKVHSANALSNRHLRTLLCDSCRDRPAYARCLDHRMFVCCGCDQRIHGVSSQHQKRILSSYMGCPSAKDFAALWGFQLDEMDKSALRDQLFSKSFASVKPSVATFDIPIVSRQQTGSSSRTSKLNYSTLVSGTQSEVGLSNKQTEEPCKGQGQQNNEFILQQILYLEKLQLTEVDNCSPIIRGVEEMDVSSSIFKGSEKFEDSVDLSQHAQDPGKGDCLLQELKVDSLPSPFSQPENSPLPSTAANPLLGESFWQYRSPLQSDQLWSQNMQDLGVCEDNACHDDFNMPDVDITFRNFEELFGTEEDPIRALLDDKDASWSSVEKDMSVDTSHCRNARPREDISVASSFYVGQPQINKNIGPPNQVYNLQRNLDSPRTIRPSYSAMSFSISRFSAEGSGTKYVDSGLSPYITGTEVSYHSSDLEGAHSEAKENAMVRYKEKKKARTQEKQIRYAPRKARTDVRKRIKGRVVKKEDYDSDTVDVTRSY